MSFHSVLHTTLSYVYTALVFVARPLVFPIAALPRLLALSPSFLTSPDEPPRKDMVLADKDEKLHGPSEVPNGARLPNGVYETPAPRIPRRFPVGARLANPATPDLKPHVGPDLTAYREAYAPTIGDKTSDAWWAQIAREHVHWYRDFGDTVTAGGFEKGDIVWFPDGQLNVSYNCVDRWAQEDPERIAIIYEADEPQDSYTISYGTLLTEVSKLANVLRNSFGVRKGDVVTIYLPVHWRAAVALLACARIGAIHSVVFAGFSADALGERIRDARSRVIITADEGRRGGKTMQLKSIVDRALESSEVDVEHVLVLRRTDSEDIKRSHWTEGRDVWWDDEVARQPAECEPEVMNAEDPLFILYTSGSTGKPKGVVHTTGGYLVQTAASVKYIFDLHPGDRFACVADIGWITGHTFVTYGPLANGVATTFFESTPTYPTPSRYWDAVDRWKLTQFYCAPTAIRSLRRLGPSHVSPSTHSLSSLRVIGSGGEPTNPEAWHWYNEHVGRNGQCAVLDTWWTTETGAIMIAPFPGAVMTKPGTSGVPFFGILPAVLHAETGEKLTVPGGLDVEPCRKEGEEWESEEGLLVIGKPWPAIARTIWGDHERYLDTYMRPHPGYFHTGDGAAIDQNGYFSIKGRVDDVINVSGRRLSTSEIESALLRHPLLSEAAVIGADDALTGQAVHAFVTCRSSGNGDTSELERELKLCVRQAIGAFAAPKRFYFVNNLPTTRSGKLMRRVMRKIVAGEGDRLGDLSTVADPATINEIQLAVAYASRPVLSTATSTTSMDH